MPRYYKDPFAIVGDKAVVPNAIQGDGSISYTEGFGENYAIDPALPNSLKVPRPQTNDLFFDVTENIQQYQQHGVPDFITTLDNEGVPYPYDIWAIVRYDDGGGFDVYQSIVDSNTSLPTDETKWDRLTDVITTIKNNPNYVRNPQFTRWGNNNFLDPDNTNDIFTEFKTSSGNSIPRQNVIADDWIFVFSESTTLGEYEISRQKFPLQQTEVPASPVNYLKYECTSAADDQVFISIAQDFDGIETFGGEELSFGIWARSATSSDLRVDLQQRPGTGGTPSIVMGQTVISTTLTTEWEFYSGTVNIPDIPPGFTLGTDGNNSFRIEIRFPNNSLAEIDLCNAMLNIGPELPSFPYLPVCDQIREANETSTWQGNPTGTVIFNISSNNISGYILMNDSTIGAPGSGASYAISGVQQLYILLWDSVSNTYAPVTGGRGASAIDDYNALKPMQLLEIAGRVLGGAGSGAGLTPRQSGETTGQETHQLTINEMPSHNHSIQVMDSAGTGGPFIDHSQNNPFSTTSTGSRGGNAAHNNMQPTLFLFPHIKL